MSLFDSLTTAVSGLSAQQKAISNISDNIANAQTIGYKGVNTSFESLVLSNGQNQDSGDVGVQSVFTNNVAGSVVQSQQSTSMAINGNGFFTVKAPPAVNATGTTQTFATADLYTRRGDFQVNTNGFLVNGAGYYLEGYAVSPTGVVATGSTAPIQIPQTQSAPTPTSLVSLLSNLPSNYPLTTDTGYTSPPPVTTQVFDAQGNPHSVSIQFDHTAANTWTATVTAAGTQAPDDTPIKLTMAFSDGTDKVATGDAAPAPAGTLLSITDSTTYPTGADAAVVTAAADNGPATISLNWNFLGSATNDNAQAVTLNLGSYGSSSSSTTQFAGTTVQVAGETANGSAPGTFTGVSVDNNGFVSLTYSNGQTLKAFQLALAQFNAPDSLQSVDGNTFAATEDSGTPIIGAPGAGGNGTISPSSLEQSNVDISTELTKLITAQQVYTSNAKVITTANQMLQTVSNLIQG